MSILITTLNNFYISRQLLEYSNNIERVFHYIGKDIIKFNNVKVSLKLI